MWHELLGWGMIVGFVIAFVLLMASMVDIVRSLPDRARGNVGHHRKRGKILLAVSAGFFAISLLILPALSLLHVGS